MKKISKILVTLSILSFLIFPIAHMVYSADSLVPCGTEYTTQNINGKDIKVISNPCDGKEGWNKLLELVNNVLNFVLFKLAVPIAAISFAYAGFLLLTSGGNTEAKSKAKGIFTNVAIGFIIALAAWLIVKLILSVLGYSGGWIGF